MSISEFDDILEYCKSKVAEALKLGNITFEESFLRLIGIYLTDIPRYILAGTIPIEMGPYLLHRYYNLQAVIIESAYCTAGDEATRFSINKYRERWDKAYEETKKEVELLNDAITNGIKIVYTPTSPGFPQLESAPSEQTPEPDRENKQTEAPEEDVPPAIPPVSRQVAQEEPATETQAPEANREDEQTEALEEDVPLPIPPLPGINYLISKGYLADDGRRVLRNLEEVAVHLHSENVLVSVALLGRYFVKKNGSKYGKSRLAQAVNAAHPKSTK